MMVTVLLLLVLFPIVLMTDNYLPASLDRIANRRREELAEREQSRVDKEMMEWNGADDRRQWPPRMKRTMISVRRSDSLFDAIK